MKPVVSWYLPDKVLLMTCHQVIEINDLEKVLWHIASLVDDSSATRIYLIVDTREVKTIPGLIEMLSIRIKKREKFEDIVIVGLKNGLLRMLILQAMRNVNQHCEFVASFAEAEAYINQKECDLYELPLLDQGEEETVETKRRKADKQ